MNNVLYENNLGSARLTELLVPAIVYELERVPDAVVKQQVVLFVEFRADEYHLFVLGDEELDEILEDDLSLFGADDYLLVVVSGGELFLEGGVFCGLFDGRGGGGHEWNRIR